MTPLARGILTSGKLGAAKFARYFMSKFNPSYGVGTPDDNSLDLTNDFSGCAWAYQHTNATQYIMSKYRASGNNKSWFFFINGSGFLSFGHSVNGSTDVNFISTISVPLNTLSLVHFRLTGGTLYLGMNDSAEQSVARGACFSGTATVEVGKANLTAYSNNFDITQPMLFNSGSSLANFTTIYNEGKPKIFPSLPTSITDDAVMAFELSSNDSTLIDLSGTGNNGAFIGGSFTNGQSVLWDIEIIEPSIGSTALLNGSNQYFTFPNDITSGLSTFSIGFFIKPNNVTSSQRIFNEEILGDAQFRVSLSATGKIVTGYRTTAAGPENNYTSVSSLLIGTWYSVFITLDVSSSIKIYIDAVEDLDTAISTTAITTGSRDDRDICQRGVNGTQRVNGSIGFMGCWSSSISAAAISDFHNSGNAFCRGSLPASLTSTLLHYWHLAEFTGHTTDELTDQEGINSLTAFGAPTFTGTGLDVEC